jgi:hypothetical protein
MQSVLHWLSLNQETIWGWTACICTVLGTLLAIITVIFGAVTLKQVKQEYKVLKRQEEERQRKIDILRREIIDYAHRPLGDTSFSSYTKLVNQLLRLDLFAKNPVAGIPLWENLFNLVQKYQIQESLKKETKKPDDE